MLEEILQHITQCIKNTRSLTFNLCPTILYDLGFEAAVESLLKKAEKEHGLKCELEKDNWSEPEEKDTEIILYRAVQELLHNVIKYSQCDCVKVSMKGNRYNTFVTVEDNGIGFDVSKLNDNAGEMCGFGLFNIRERLNSLGGEVNIESRHGKGTRVTLEVPHLKGARL